MQDGAIMLPGFVLFLLGQSPLMVPVSLPSAIPATSKGPESCAMRAQRRLLGAVAPEYSGKGEAL